jgi:DNA-binding response OmpR family regulator
MSHLGSVRSTASDADVEHVDAEDTPASARRPRVLIIDDQPMARVWARGILQTEFDCFETGSVQEFFELALRERPDVILADLEMVPLNGVQLCRLTKAQPALADVPFLLLTAHASDATAIGSSAEGADAHLSKSLTPRELVGRVQAMVRLRRERLEAEFRLPRQL